MDNRDESATTGWASSPCFTAERDCVNNPLLSSWYPWQTSPFSMQHWGKNSNRHYTDYEASTLHHGDYTRHEELTQVPPSKPDLFYPGNEEDPMTVSENQLHPVRMTAVRPTKGTPTLSLFGKMELRTP